MAQPKRYSAAEKGKARREGPDSPPPKHGRGRLRKHPVSPAAAPRGRGCNLKCGDGRLVGEARRGVVASRVPAPSPLPRGGALISAPRRLLGADDSVEDVLERARERRALRQGFLRRAADAVSLLCEELADEDVRLEAKGLRLVAKRRELEAAVALARRQRDLDDEAAKAARAASRGAPSQAVEEAREADQR